MYNFKYNEYDAYVYDTELKDFLPDNFIDLHTHIWKNDFEPYGCSNGGATWTHLVADEMTGSDLCDTYLKLFPGKKVAPLVFGGVDQNISQCNDFVQNEKKTFGFPVLFRTDYSMSADEVENSVKNGGYLGIKPYITNCPSYIPASEIRIFDYLPHEHLEVADRNGWIVMLHIPRSGRFKDPVNLGQLLEIEKKYKNLKLVVAHVGRAYSKQDIGNAFDVLKNTENMLFDFTANLCDDAISGCIETFGTGRLMFGSDLPISIMRMYRITDGNGFYYNIVPKGMYGDISSDPHMVESYDKRITFMIYEQLRAFKRVASKLKLSDNDIEKIMYLNSFGLINRR